jgi:hypothetical protein
VNLYRKAKAHAKRVVHALSKQRKELPFQTLPLLLGFAMVMPTSSRAADRGLWLWNTDSVIQNLGTSRAQLLSFCAAPHGTNSISSFTGSAKPVTVLYLYSHKYVSGTSIQQSQLRNFLAAAHGAGLKVQFLDGAPDWATTGKAYGENYLRYALAFNAASTSASQKFDGIQYDVEPYLDSGWFSQSLWDSFTGLLTDCETMVKNSGQGIPFGVCIPRWYDITPGPGYLLQVQQITDYVAVMDYVNTVSSLVSDAASEVANATQLGKKIVLGVETMNVSPATSTFNALGYGNMEIALDSLAQAYQSSNGYAGNAVHYYDTYASLTEWGTAGPPAMLAAASTTTISTTGTIPLATTTTTSTTTLRKKRRS